MNEADDDILRMELEIAEALVVLSAPRITTETLRRLPTNLF